MNIQYNTTYANKQQFRQVENNPPFPVVKANVESNFKAC